MEESGERVVDEGLRAIDKRTGKYVIRQEPKILFLCYQGMEA